jgi:hypothetical protein
MRANKLPTQAYLKECFHYNKRTGTLRWKHRPVTHFSTSAQAARTNSRQAGKEAGSVMHGHLAVFVNGTSFYVHRVIWRMVTGDDPGLLEVDHRNTNRQDNRWKNLRLATGLQQRFNASIRSDNTSGVKGVTWYAPARKWQAQISVNGRMQYLGRFVDLEVAADVVRQARRKLHQKFANDG